MDGSTQCLHLLVVDDDRDAAQALAQLLPFISRVPMTTAVAFDGQQAVAVTCSAPTPPDVIILDMEMPGLNGLDAAAAIRARLRDRTPYLIAVSGNVKQVRLAASTGVFNRALRKPIDVDELARLLEGACPQG
jgi:two-component system response regulator DesR